MKVTTIHRIATSLPAAAITFDDGPHPEYTPRALAIMKTYNMKGTWFVLGKMAAQFPWLAPAIKDHGHDVGTHNYEHSRLTSQNEKEMTALLRRTRDTIRKQTGKFWPLLRPPYGAFNAAVLKAADNLGYRWNVLWSVDPQDYSSSTDQIVATVTAGLAPGAIVLLHEVSSRTAEALPAIFQEMKRRGLRSASLTEILAAPGTGQHPVPFCRHLKLTFPYLYGEDVEAVQLALAARGMDVGEIDGFFGPRSAAAVSRFQTAAGLAVTGEVSADVYTALTINCRKKPRE